jgi:hypothetical protein
MWCPLPRHAAGYLDEWLKGQRTQLKAATRATYRGRAGHVCPSPSSQARKRALAGAHGRGADDAVRRAVPELFHAHGVGMTMRTGLLMRRSATGLQPRSVATGRDSAGSLTVQDIEATGRHYSAGRGKTNGAPPRLDESWTVGAFVRWVWWLRPSGCKNGPSAARRVFQP